MNKEHLKQFYGEIIKKGSDFVSIRKSDIFGVYTLEELEGAYVELMSHIKGLHPKEDMNTEIKQIKDVYRIDGDIYFDVLAEDGRSADVVKKEVYFNDIGSKIYTLMQDYKFFLLGKINMISELEEAFETENNEETTEKEPSAI